jgi:S1-C subfamily serine protease
MDTAGSSSNNSTASSSDSTATIGFAIPIDNALAVVKQITSGTGTSTVHIGDTAFLGIGVSSSSASGGLGSGGLGSGSGGFGSGSSSGLGSGDNTGSGSTGSTSGATVVNVVTGSPAAQAGIAAGDTITGIDGKTVTSPTDISSALVSHHPGDRVSVTWTDSTGTSQTATLTLASGPPA